LNEWTENKNCKRGVNRVENGSDKSV
jgi:hypothetical protein